MTQPIPKKVLLTGVTGQDASYMADYLLATTDHLIYGMVRRTSKADLSNLTQALTNSRFQLVVGDLSDSQSIDNLVREIRPDYFINLGAQSYVGSSWTLPEMTLDVTGVGVVRVLEAVRRHVPLCKIYSAGSSEQWGDVAYSPQDEEHPMRPRSPYGCAKCLASHLVKTYRESYGLYAVHGVLLNHESPRRGQEFVSKKITLGVARICRAIKDGKPFEPIELGNLNAARDWSHALDFIEGIWLMLHQEDYREDLRTACLRILNGEQPEKWREYAVKHLSEYVLASGQTQTVRVFVEKAFTEAGVVGHWEGVGADETYVRDVCTHGYEGGEDLVCINPAFYRPADVEHLHGTPAKIKAELGWQPKWSFDDLVRDMVKHDLAAVGL